MACLPIEWKYIDISATEIKCSSGGEKKKKKEKNPLLWTTRSVEAR